MATLTWLRVPGDEKAWAALGFTVVNNAVQIGRVRCELAAADQPEVGWGFAEIYSAEPTLDVDTKFFREQVGDVEHPCGVTHIDHVVYTVPDLDAGVAALTAVLGVPPRRRFFPRGPNGPEMAFYRVGEAFIEVVAAGTAPALIGLALASADLDATVAAIRDCGGPISDPKPAVQGGRIASVWRGHLNWGLAIMGP